MQYLIYGDGSESSVPKPVPIFETKNDDEDSYQQLQKSKNIYIIVWKGAKVLYISERERERSVSLNDAVNCYVYVASLIDE